MSTIENGMTVKVRHDVEVPEELATLRNDNKHIKLSKEQNYSCVLDDGSVMIKGIGYFEKELFEPTGRSNKGTYELIIHTQNVFEQGGAYQSYDSVIEHFEEAHGVRVITKSGEWFHPWSYDGGIRAVFVPN